MAKSRRSRTVLFCAKSVIVVDVKGRSGDRIFLNGGRSHFG
ncbi:hypothetical protein [Microcoleus sp. bin38.metabat.b11b12b14.051]|nr:hypothetical protein [Microcoleus sp. bin38.metabat.b11b12b14.051]